ncbi:DUF6766 family protein [Salana multivorans]
MSRLARTVRVNGLGLAFGVAFLLALGGQAAVGVVGYNEELTSAGRAPISLGRYLASAAFAVDVAENWQSEFLQFLLFILATVWLVQRGSPESKRLDEAGRGSDEEQKVGSFATPDSPAWARVRGLRGWLYSHSLVLVMGTIFLASWAVQSVAGHVAYNKEQALVGEPGVTYGEYLLHPDFWGRTLQNWQSELLAVAAMVVFSIYLRERGSPESKPVGEAHSTTGATG